MKFKHLTEQQINQERGILSPGICRWECLKEEDAMSQSGNYMKVLTLHVWDCNGIEGNQKTYLVDMPSMHWKLKHFFASAGDAEQYERDELPPGWCIGKSGHGLLTPKKAGYGNNGKWYGESVDMGDFLDPKDPRINSENKSEFKNIPPTGIRLCDSKPDFDDDIPF